MLSLHFALTHERLIKRTHASAVPVIRKLARLASLETLSSLRLRSFLIAKSLLCDGMRALRCPDGHLKQPGCFDSLEPPTLLAKGKTLLAAHKRARWLRHGSVMQAH